MKVKLMKQKKACEPIQISAECTTEATNFGSLPSPNACARKVIRQMARHSDCSDLFMFSTSYPGWGCRCCSLNGAHNTTGNANWALFSNELYQHNIMKVIVVLQSRWKRDVIWLGPSTALFLHPVWHNNYYE